MNPSSEDNSTIERDSKKVPVVRLYHHNIGNDLCQNTSILLVPETNEQDSEMLIEPCETVEKSMNKIDNRIENAVKELRKKMKDNESSRNEMIAEKNEDVMKMIASTSETQIAEQISDQIDVGSVLRFYGQNETEAI